MTIWKFKIPITDLIELEMPKGAQVIHVEGQGACGSMWAIVKPTAERVKRQFYLIGTGHNFDKEGKCYMGTFLTGEFVWHLFEII